MFSLKDGKPRSNCKPCAVKSSQESQARRRINDPEGYKAAKAAAARRRVYKKYNVTQDDIDLMLVKQDGKCYLCDEDIRQKPYVDHNHKTGKIRKLLCFHCNVGLGHFKDSIELMQKAIDYIKAHSD